LPHVVIRHLCVAWRYFTAAKPTHYTCNRNLRSHTMLRDHTKSPCRCHLRVWHGLDPSMDWIGLDWIGLGPM